MRLLRCHSRKLSQSITLNVVILAPRGESPFQSSPELQKAQTVGHGFSNTRLLVCACIETTPNIKKQIALFIEPLQDAFFDGFFRVLARFHFACPSADLFRGGQD
jgi:hypothetical protein